MLTRRPAPRPYDVIALELVLALASAVQVGLLLWLAVATWDDRGATGTPVIGALAVVALAVGAGWFLWLVGVNGWLLAGASGVAGLQVGFLLILGASGQVTGVSTSMLVASLACAVLGLLCGVFLPSPSSRRYRPEPRVRADAGSGSSAPRVSPSVARAADRYAKGAVVGVAAGAAAATSAGVRKASRSGSKGAPAAGAEIAEPAPVLQPRAGTPIRTSGPVDGDVQPAGGAATTRSSRPTGAEPTVAPRGAGASAPPPPSAPSPKGGTSPAGTSATTPPSGNAARPASRSGATPRQDPGAIARSGRASIDAELSSTPRAGTPTASQSSASPGFRLVEPPKPMTSVKRPPSDGPRLSAVDRPPPPRPPRGQPVGRVGDVQQVGDPGSVQPSIRSLPPAPPSTATPPRSASPADDTLPYPAWDPAWDPPGDDR